MIYQLRRINDGALVDSLFDSDKAPKIGDEVFVEGHGQCVRIPSFHIDSAGIKRKTEGYPFVSRSLPKGCHPESQDEGGRPIIRSQAEERSVLARTGYIRE